MSTSRYTRSGVAGCGFNEGVTMRTGVLAAAMAVTAGLVGCEVPMPRATRT